MAINYSYPNNVQINWLGSEKIIAFKQVFLLFKYKLKRPKLKKIQKKVFSLLLSAKYLTYNILNVKNV
ncbi:hypothetical protein AHMF7605_08915 [Adhaeribacter arboris]|uniref:Uncharacterized protein n=1 Tax=Adhaeribacter arboris TaxID=2072846 RepID=A0A2T2YDQ6_9BACT|nr:hypothetical protein AHMF7605_08915 [Adhaeribacter arboris]